MKVYWNWSRFGITILVYLNNILTRKLLNGDVETILYTDFVLQGPYEVGNVILGFDGVTQIMLALAGSTNSMHQVGHLVN